MRPSVIATLATNAVKTDLQLFLFTLGLWNRTPPTVYLMCDAAIAAAVPEMGYKGTIVTKQTLDKYAGLTRAQMERMPSPLGNLWMELMLEKTNIEWVFHTGTDQKGTGVYICDSDICFMGPLVDIPPGTKLAVSRHEIREQDEARFGAYNGGMIWLSEVSQLQQWREAAKTSRFFEQAAIEDLVAATPGTYQIPRQENYGWWRMWQGVRPSAELAAEWGLHRSPEHSGITVAGAPLGSIHTHFAEVRDAATHEYNKWIVGWLRRLNSHPPAKRLLQFLERLHPWIRAV
jgi:hypothetical protein